MASIETEVEDLQETARPHEVETRAPAANFTRKTTSPPMMPKLKGIWTW